MNNPNIIFNREMKIPAKIKQISIPKDKRVICVSDIHGEVILFKQLLTEVGYCADDVLMLLGDIYTKGSYPYETLKYCIELSKFDNVHIIRGNTDWGNPIWGGSSWSTDDYSTEEENKWLNNLPDILESEEYIFVHSGLTSMNLKEQYSATTVKVNNFMEISHKFDKWVVVGHWPVHHYCHKVYCANPIINYEKKIISIDGGNVLAAGGQLNAFVILDNQFSYISLDSYPKLIITKPQSASGGNISITYLDRFIEIINDDEQLCRVRHIETGRILDVPKSRIWVDKDGNTCICDLATDYYLPCNEGDIVGVIEEFPNQIIAKLNGTIGWIKLE